MYASAQGVDPRILSNANCWQCMALSNTKLGPESSFYKSPIAYNGRTWSILAANVDFHRLKGVFKTQSTGRVEFQPTRKLDYETEMGVFISSSSPVGKLIDPATASDLIFGYVLLNYWSARDIQMYESIPLDLSTQKPPRLISPRG